MKLYDKSKIDMENLMFDNKALWAITFPIMVEQFLNCLMGTADSMMVSNVGSAALSAVSCVDSINILVFQVFSALATGGTILCSQYIGLGNKEKAKKSADQVFLTVLFISVVLMLVCIFLKLPILRLVFGSVEEAVMTNAATYFFITALSYPALALFDAGAAFMRASGNSRFPMNISIASNLINIAGNAILIFGFDMGVAGAAIATTVSRYISVIVVYIGLSRPNQPIVINHYLAIRPDMPVILKVLSIGIPAGVENGMFQFGKLAIQSSVSTLGTTAIAAQAMAALMENFNGMIALGIGIAMMTVVGQSVGAGRKEESRYYIVKMSIWAEIVVVISVIVILILTKPITVLAGMDPTAADMCFEMVVYISIVKPIVWTFAFLPSYGMRAAGDVRFSMLTSMCTMWFCRVALSTFLIRVVGIGILGVWIGMFSDWTIRAIIFSIRYMHGKWLDIKVI